uniref:SF4 helicase domain-containing protein n=1 Tax=Globodera pallida TaxID=36090 RepID=A0A183C5B5_GLOPA
MSDEEFEEIERIVLGLEEPDTDLYDRVAYLDMVKQHQQAQRRKLALLREGERKVYTHFGKQFDQHADAKKYQTVEKHEALAALPVVGSTVYTQMDLCDCAIFAECPLGKAGGGLRAVPARRCRSHARKRSSTLAQKQSLAWSQKQMPTSDNDDDDEYTDVDHQQPVDQSQPQWCRCRKRHCADCAKINAKGCAGTKNVVDSSPSSSGPGSDFDDDFVEVCPPRGVLFRLPVTITKSQRCRTASDCRVHGSAATALKQCMPGRVVDYTQMGLFVAPPSETDPDEAFVVVERHRPLTEKPSPVGEVSVSGSTAASFTPLPPAPSAASPRHRLLRHQAHSASADNLLIRTSDLGSAASDVPSLPPPPPAPRDRSRGDLFEEESLSAPTGKTLSFEEPAQASDLDQMRPQQMPRRDVSPKVLKDTKSAGIVDTVDQREQRSSMAAASDPRIRHIWSEAIELGEIRNVEDQTEFRSLRAQLGIDKISAETLSQYHVKGHMDHFDQPAICYPRYRGPSTRNRLPTGLKLIRRVADKLIKENYPSTEDKVRFTGMFGLHMLTQFDNRVVLTTNERDALKISAETLSQYHVKGHMDHFDQPAICYPRYRGPSTRNRLPTGLKLIRRVADKLIKENYPSTEDKVRFTGMFGLHMLTQFDNRVVLTTNERDALAVYDASNGIPALSLPKGERFDQSVLPYLEDFDLVYLWFPSIHERFAKDYASYMNATRCYIITAPLRPVELIRDGRSKEVLHNIQDAVRVRYKGFRSVGDLRDAVRGEIVQSKSRLSGIAQWRRYALLNNYLRGFRPGEISVISGGHYGKTTFLCEYAMDLYSQGIRTMFCNFEMPEDKILKWMIIQFAGPSHVRSQARARSHAFFSARSKAPLQRHEHSSVEMWLDKFERTQGDLLIMKTDEFRDKTLKEIADAIRDQVITSGTQHLVIDNLQSLVDLATVSIDTMSAGERIHQQDRFVGMLRRLANSQELHITVVVHPVKESNEHGYYELQHIGGPSAKIAQEADNVLVIQRRRDLEDRRRFRKFLYILKNRYGGRCIEVDQIEMLFQPTTLMHTLVEVNK